MIKKILLLLLFSTTIFSINLAQTCNLDFENFETSSSNSPPSGWQNNGGYIVSDTPNTSNSYSGMNYAGLNDVNDEIIIEPVTCPGEICFYWRASSPSVNWDVDIDWSTNSGMTWSTAQTISFTAGDVSPITYAQECVDLPEAAYLSSFSGVLVRFHMTRREGGSIYFDDVCMSRGGCIITPTRLTFSNLQDGCLQKDTPFSLEVCVTDENNNIDETYNSTISLAGTNLSGMTSQTAVNGCVQFPDLEISDAGNYILTATSDAFTNDTDSIAIVNMCPLTKDLKVVTYNLLNFPNGRDDCGAANTVIPARWDSLQIVMDYIKPDVLMVCELQNEAGADSILLNSLNVDTIDVYARANFVINQSSGGTSLNNAFFYNSEKMTLYAQDEILTNVRDIGKYTVYVNDPNLAVHQDTVFIDFYTAHLKASNLPSSVASREMQCNALQNHMNMDTIARNAVFGGDFNFYDSAEPGYQVLLSGTYPFNDPLDMPGSWDGNIGFSSLHTQSTRATNSDLLDCGASGGMDSRFDFLLTSNPIMDGTHHVTYIAESYKAFGNGGNIYNDSIDDPTNNSMLPDSILSALRHISDHIPVLMDLEVSLPQAILSFDLLSFSVKSANEVATIEWEVADENADLDFFTLQRSRDKRNFVDVINMDKTDITIYSYSEKLNVGTTHYRLKSTEIDGTVSYSKVKSLTQKGTSWAIFPNPVRDVLQVKTLNDTTLNNNTFVTVYDALSRVVFSQNVGFENGLTIQTGAWRSGVYLVEIVSGGERSIYRIVK